VARRKPEVPKMMVRQPGQKVALVVPPKQSPAQGKNTASRIRFGPQARKDFPHIAALWANDNDEPRSN
jgi:hypothetical protein